MLLVLSRGVFSIDPSMMSSLDTIIGLNGVAGSPSASEIQGIHGMIAGDVLELLPEAVLDTLNPKTIALWKVQS